ncbi:MAG: hypothetical protein ACO1NW_18570 [Chitinophagaceae bacterium]
MKPNALPPAALRGKIILLFLLGLQYFLLLRGTMKSAFDYTFCETCPTDYLLIADWISLLYIPAIYYQLYKRRWWGWLLLVINNILFVTVNIAQTKIHSAHYPFIPGPDLKFLLPPIVKTLVVLFLFNGNAQRFFNISKRIFVSTIIAGGMLAAGIWLWLQKTV